MNIFFFRSPLPHYVEVRHVDGYPILSNPYMFRIPLETPGYNISGALHHSSYLSFAPPEVTSWEAIIYKSILLTWWNHVGYLTFLTRFISSKLFPAKHLTRLLTIPTRWQTQKLLSYMFKCNIHFLMDPPWTVLVYPMFLSAY